MKLFNYLFLLLLFPLAQYAVIEDDLVQLVIVFEDINTLLSATLSARQKEKEELEKKQRQLIIDKLEGLSNNVQEAINYFSAARDINFKNYSKFSVAMNNLKKAIDEEIQQESVRTEKLFTANELEEIRTKFFVNNYPFYRIFASYVLIEYPKIYPRITIGQAIVKPQEIDTILKESATFFEIPQTLPEDKVKILESIFDKYLNLLDNSMEDQQFSKDMEEILPQQMLSDFLELINDNPIFATLINSAIYSRARDLLKTLNQRYPNTAIPIPEPREQIKKN